MLANLKRRHLVLAGIVFVVLLMSLFQVTQGTSALLLRFGKLGLTRRANQKYLRLAYTSNTHSSTRFKPLTCACKQ